MSDAGRSDPARSERAPVAADRVRARLGSSWARVAVVAETASTNADLLADGAAPDRSVLVAEYQAAGRGRLDRVWVSPPGAGLTFSVLLRPSVPVASWGWLPLLAGVALREAVAASTGVAASLKWPNDLLVGTPARKAAGILAQTGGAAVVIGVGLNVSSTAEELPIEAATSLALAGAPTTDRSALLAAILDRLDAHYRRWTAAGGDAEASGLAATYRDACATIGRAVVVTGLDSSTLRGTALGIDASGRLRVRVGAAVDGADGDVGVDGADGDVGVEHVVGAGDVAHLRPA